ncbi:MAG: four helix bundle protein [bacterium]
MYSFEKLEVWQKTRKFLKRIYEITSFYPKQEQFGLIQHTRKSVVSILSSIAEGSSRFSKTDFKRYLQISIGSLYETVSQLFVALDNNYLTNDLFNELYNDSEYIAKMLSKLSKSQSL